MTRHVIIKTIIPRARARTRACVLLWPVRNKPESRSPHLHRYARTLSARPPTIVHASFSTRCAREHLTVADAVAVRPVWSRARQTRIRSRDAGSRHASRRCGRRRRGRRGRRQWRRRRRRRRRLLAGWLALADATDAIARERADTHYKMVKGKNLTFLCVDLLCSPQCSSDRVTEYNVAKRAHTVPIRSRAPHPA